MASTFASPLTSPLISAEAIAARVAELGAQITRDFEGRSPILVCVLKGSIPFFADLSRHIGLPARFDTIQVRSYHGTESSGQVEFLSDLDVDIEGEDVLLIEDIVDTGRTMTALLANLRRRGPSSLGIVALLDKPSRRVLPVEIDYTGFTIEDRFVIGYGLDYEQHFRGRPAIDVLEEIPAE